MSALQQQSTALMEHETSDAKTVSVCSIVAAFCSTRAGAAAGAVIDVFEAIKVDV